MLLLPSICALLVPGALASSHREAPAIALDPSADLTDFYMFRSPTDTSKVVFILNVNPLSAPGGGPNFHRFDDHVLYEIKIDNEGDAVEDIVFQFRFKTSYPLGDETFLYNLGSVASAKNLSMLQTYDVVRVADGVPDTLITGGTVAPVNVGTQSVPAGGYNPESSSAGTITTANIETHGGYRFFAGPRQEGFYVDLERTFDLLNVAGADGTPNTNTLLGYNVHSIAIEVPADSLTRDGEAPSASRQNEVIAAWATTSRRAVTVRRSTGVDTASRGEWVQVARLGNPLVNEAVLPIAQKDVFNGARPVDDLQFLSWVQESLLGGYMNAILGTACPTSFDAGLGIGGREDLILAFLTGHPALGNLPSGFSLGGEIPGEAGKYFAGFEALRLNLTGTGFGQWPDGRNVGDDVVDTALSAVCGLLVDGTVIPDGVDATGLSYLSTFPYLGDPWAGDDHPAGFHDL